MSTDTLGWDSNPFSQAQKAQQEKDKRHEEEEHRRRVEERHTHERVEEERQLLSRPNNMLQSTDVSDKDLFEAELIKDLMVSGERWRFLPSS